MSEYGYITHSELMHHGVKGQKWGIRRYQNADGSYKAGSEGRYYHPIRSLMSKLHRAKRSGVTIGDKTIGGVRAKSQIKRAKYKEDRKELVKNKLLGSNEESSSKEKKVVDKNSLAYKKAKYNKAAAIATGAITAASIAGMGALIGSKALKNKKAAHNAMLKLVDNKVGGTSIKGSSIAKAALTGAKLSSKGKDNARAELRRLTNKGIDNARAFTSKQVVSKAIRTTPNSTKAHLIYDPKGFAKYNAQLLKKKKR